jgi:hypothetical protein
VSLVVGRRVLAVAADPPEVAPGDAVTLRALVVDEDGVVDQPAVRWSFCRSPRGATETGSVPDACVDGDVDVIDDATDAGDAVIEAVVPASACAVFGPDVAGGARPPDPDGTGGYFLPVRLDIDGAPLAFGAVRLACRLGDAGVDVARAFDRRYERNVAPTFIVDAPARVAARDAVDVVVRWPGASAEDFVVYDREAQRLVTTREGIVASFFATDGVFAVDRRGQEATERATTATNGWTAPSVDGVVHHVVVVRDGRGAVAWTAFDVDVAAR